MNLRDIMMGPPSVINLIGPDQKPREYTEKDLAILPHTELLAMRKANPSKDAQNLLAGYEHRAAAREAGSDSPMLGLSYGVAEPMYQLTKLMPRAVTGLDSRSDPSFAQLRQGVIGAGEGIVAGLRNKFGPR